MTTFPKNNLPTDSLNWGREVEKSINNLESTFKSAQINNITRDNQLQSNYNRLDATLVELTATNAAVDQAQNDALGALTTAAAASESVDAALLLIQDLTARVEALENAL
jgi:hypothetical protein